MIEKYMERNKKISISQVDILEFFNFYKEIAKYQYLYTLENNLKIKLAFNESNFPHLLGLHKFKIVSKYRKQSDIIEAIKNKSLNIKNLKSSEANVLINIKDRLGYFPCLNFLLNNVEKVIEFDSTKCIPTKLDATFLLNTSKISVSIYLAIKSIKNNEYNCVSVSFFVDRINQYQINKQKEYKVIEFQKIFIDI